MIVSLVLDMNDGRVHPVPAARMNVGLSTTRSTVSVHFQTSHGISATISIVIETGGGPTNRNSDQEVGSIPSPRYSHPLHNVFQDRKSEWFDFTSFQEWSRAQHSFMLNQRKEQEKLGRIIPQTNEEYGYEDHYPVWAGPEGSDSADTLRRTAWDIVMAGGYQTTGETARRGTNVWPDKGGGWMNGRGDDTMTMLQGYAHMVEFFTSFEWWTTEPHDELVNHGQLLPRAARQNIRSLLASRGQN